MKLGSLFLTSNRYRTYPFEDNAPGVDIRGDGSYSVPMVPAGFMVDANMLVWDATAVYLDSITRAANNYTLTFTDGDAAVLAAVQLPLPTLSGNGYTTIAIGNDQSPDPLHSKLYGRILVSTEFVTYLSGMEDGTYTYGDGLRFVPSVVVQRPSKVLSLAPHTGTVPSSGNNMEVGAIAGHVKLVNGYNCELDTVVSYVPDTTVITISAIAGTGLGIVPCKKEATIPVSVPHGLHPDIRGNVILEGDECYTIVSEGNKLRIYGSCTACCDCDEFVAVGNELRTLLDGTAAAYLQLKETHQGEDGYEQAVTDWNDNKYRRRGETVTLTAYAHKAYKGASNYGTMVMVIHNKFQNERVDVRYRINISTAVKCTRLVGTDGKQMGWRDALSHTQNVAWTPANVWQTEADTGTLPDMSIDPNSLVTYTWELYKAGGLPSTTQIEGEFRLTGGTEWTPMKGSPCDLEFV